MRRARCIEAIVVACMIAVTPLASATAVDVQPNNAASSPRLKYLPEDYFAVVECNVGAVMQIMTAVGAQQNPQFAQFEQYIQMAKSMTGVDVEKEVTSATLFAAGEPGPGASATVVISGTFNNATVQQHIAQMAGGNPTDYKGQAIYSTPGADVAFPEPSTILIGEPDRVRAAIDKLQAGGQTPEELKNVLDRTPATSVAWAAFTPSTLLEQAGEAWQSENEELVSELSKLDLASLYFSMADDGLLIKTLGYVEDADGAESVGKFLAERKQNLLHEEGSNVVFTSLLIFTDITSSDNYIEGALRLTGSALHELWNTRLIIAE